MEFEIKKIHVGWFGMTFNTGDKNVYIVTTSKWLNDGPKHFLQAFNEILTINHGERYVILDDEPGANIICMKKIKPGIINIKIYAIIEWYDSRIKLYGEKMPEDLEIYERLLDYNFSTVKLSHDVLESFGEYSIGEKYEYYNKHWFEFPDDDYDKLKKIVSGSNMSDVG